MTLPLIRENQNLAAYNTMGVVALARYFAAIRNESEALQVLSDERFKNNRNLILGGGSNILFLHDFDGIVLHNEIKGKEIVGESDEAILLKAGAGENWHELVMHCVKN